MPRQITAFSNPLVKRVRALRDKRHRRAEGLFLAEGLRILAEAEETIETSLATPREAGLLGTDVGLPMLMLSRHSIDTTGEPVEWVRSVYRGDRYKFVAELNRPS